MSRVTTTFDTDAQGESGDQLLEALGAELRAKRFDRGGQVAKSVAGPRR